MLGGDIGMDVFMESLIMVEGPFPKQYIGLKYTISQHTESSTPYFTDVPDHALYGGTSSHSLTTTNLIDSSCIFSPTPASTKRLAAHRAGILLRGAHPPTL